MKKEKLQQHANRKHLNSDNRGDSIDRLTGLEAANEIIAEKEIGQQRENL
ncbi:hypothetical protein [Niallia sp. 03133]